MKKLWKPWLRRGLFILGGAAVGYLYYRLVGCSPGSCVITANPWSSMLYMGLIGFLLSIALSGECCKR